jgi:hypothetical protein
MGKRETCKKRKRGEDITGGERRDRGVERGEGQRRAGRRLTGVDRIGLVKEGDAIASWERSAKNKFEERCPSWSFFHVFDESSAHNCHEIFKGMELSQGRILLFRRKQRVPFHSFNGCIKSCINGIQFGIDTCLYSSVQELLSIDGNLAEEIFKAQRRRIGKCHIICVHQPWTRVRLVEDIEGLEAILNSVTIV